MLFNLRKPGLSTSLLILLAGLTGGLSGCQCCGLAETYMDGVDHIADHEGICNRWYSPALDLTRIGRRDWCSYEINNWLCGCRCNDGPPAACPTYVHLGYGWENRAMKKTGPVVPYPDDAVIPESEKFLDPGLPTPAPYSPPTQAPAPQPVSVAPVPADSPVISLNPVNTFVMEPITQVEATVTTPAPVAASAPIPTESTQPASAESLDPKGYSNSVKKSATTPKQGNYVTPISGRSTR